MKYNKTEFLFYSNLDMSDYSDFSLNPGGFTVKYVDVKYPTLSPAVMALSSVPYVPLPWPITGPHLWKKKL